MVNPAGTPYLSRPGNYIRAVLTAKSLTSPLTFLSGVEATVAGVCEAGFAFFTGVETAGAVVAGARGAFVALDAPATEPNAI